MTTKNFLNHRVLWLLIPLLTLFNLSVWGTDVTTTFSDQYLAVGDGEPEWSGTSGSGFEDDRGVQYSATNGTTKTFTCSDFHGKTIKSVSAVVSRNKSGYTVSISVSVNNTTLGDGDTSGDQPNKETITTSDDEGIACEDGDVVVTISTGGPSSSAKSLYVKSISVTYETAPSVAQTVRFYKTDGTYTDITEASAGAGVTPPSMEATCDGWTFQGWSTSYSNSTTSTTVLSTVTLTTGKYFPSSATTLYPVYTKSGGTAFSSYSLVSLGGTITSGKYIVSTGSYSKNNSTASGGGSVSPSTTEQTSYELTITSYSTYFTIQLSGGNYLGATDGTGIQSTANKASDANYQWTYNSNGIYCSNQSRYMRANGTSDFRNYKTNNNYSGSTQAKLYKRTESTTTYYYSYPSCCDELGSINGSFK